MLPISALEMKMKDSFLYKNLEKECSKMLLVSTKVYSPWTLITLFVGNAVALYVKDFFSCHTIRSTTCLILVPFHDMRCENCMEYRKILHAMLHRHGKSMDGSTEPSSHTNYRYANSFDRARIMNCIIGTWTHQERRRGYTSCTTKLEWVVG